MAPTSGRIGLRQVDPGNIVNTSDTNGIALITQIQPIAVLYTIPEDNLPAVLRARAPVWTDWRRAEAARHLERRLSGAGAPPAPTRSPVWLRATQRRRIKRSRGAAPTFRP